MGKIVNLPNNTNKPNYNFNSKSYRNISENTLRQAKDRNVIIESNTKPKGVISMNEDYVTKAELDMHSKMIDVKLDSIKEGTYTRMDSLSNEIKYMGSNLNENMEKTIKLAMYENEKSEREERKETKRYIVGTLIVGGLGILVSIVTFIMSKPV